MFEYLLRTDRVHLSISIPAVRKLCCRFTCCVHSFIYGQSIRFIYDSWLNSIFNRQPHSMERKPRKKKKFAKIIIHIDDHVDLVRKMCKDLCFECEKLFDFRTNLLEEKREFAAKIQITTIEMLMFLMHNLYIAHCTRLEYNFLWCDDYDVVKIVIAKFCGHFMRFIHWSLITIDCKYREL